MDTMARGFVSSTTRESLKETISAARELPTKLQTQDIIGLFIFWALLPVSFLFEVSFVINFWFIPFSEGWWIRVAALLYLGLNVYLNALCLAWRGANGGKSDLPSVMKSEFAYCHRCQLNSPPRSHHCPVCDKCVMRRDHHCSFTACCVGHFNQRYYVAAVAYLWLICLIFSSYNWSLLWTTLPRSSAMHYWKLVIPHIALATGSISVYQFFIIVVFVTSLTTFAFVTYLCVSQLFGLLRGQTRVEYLQDVHAYNLGFMENVRQTLGERWPLVFLSPFFVSPLQSDGISFKTKQMEGVYRRAKYM